MSECENCLHKKVCAKYVATGGYVKECEDLMDNYTATEVAYKNGYEKGYEDGVKEFTKKLIEHYFYDLERISLFEEDINNFADKMINN